MSANTDITIRLRRGFGGLVPSICDEAANEIERLRQAPTPTSGNDEITGAASLEPRWKEALDYTRKLIVKELQIVDAASGNDEVEAMCERLDGDNFIDAIDDAETLLRKQAAEIAEMERVVHDLINQMFQLKADGAQYQKDAERYREARHNADFKVEYSNGISEWVELEDEKLDAAIDAAIAKEGKPTQTADSETVAHPETE